MKLDERSTIPIYAIAMSLPFVVAFVMWLASVDAKASLVQELKPMVIDILQRVIKIEEHMR